MVVCLGGACGWWVGSCFLYGTGHVGGAELHPQVPDGYLQSFTESLGVWGVKRGVEMISKPIVVALEGGALIECRTCKRGVLGVPARASVMLWFSLSFIDK